MDNRGANMKIKRVKAIPKTEVVQLTYKNEKAGVVLTVTQRTCSGSYNLYRTPFKDYGLKGADFELIKSRRSDPLFNEVI